MDAAIWGLIGSLAGTVVGASASIFTTFISGKNTAFLQKAANSLERTERARSFQRENLIALQDALLDAMRLMNRAHHADMLAAREGGEWGKSMLGDELNQEIMLANRKLAILTERVADDVLRADLKKLRQTITKCLFASSENESTALILSVAPEFETFMENLGVLLRHSY